MNNKIVEIRKTTHFEYDWALFYPFTIKQSSDGLNKDDVKQVVRFITYATEINVILTEPCLPGSILEEIKWVNKEIHLNAAVKDASILARYSDLHFDKEIVDPSISVNYLSIDGREKVRYLIDDGFISIKNEWNDFLSPKDNSKVQEKPEYTFLNDAAAVYLLGRKEPLANLIADECKAQNIPCYNVLEFSDFSKETLENNRAKGIHTIVTSYVTGGTIILSDNNGKLYTVVRNKICVPVSNVFDLVGNELFASVCDGNNDANNQAEFRKYLCKDGTIEEFKLSKQKVIYRQVDFSALADFIEERFDDSETANYNDYSGETEEVVYQYELIPPRMDNRKVSFVYDNLKNQLQSCCAQMDKARLDDMVQFAFQINNAESSFSQACQLIMDWHKRIDKYVSIEDYSDCRRFLLNVQNDFDVIRKKTKDCIKELYLTQYKETESSQYSKIDEEISGYQAIIREKEIQVAENNDVLNCKRRIEILTKKIADLSALKEQFAANNITRANKGFDEFWKACEISIQGGTLSNNQNTSLSQIVNPKDSKLRELTDFVCEYLPGFGKIIESILAVVLPDVPDGYTLFDYNGKRAIIVKDVDEYKATIAVCQKYDLECYTD